MKKVITGVLLQDKILKSIHLLCGSVKHTLGPKGCNVLINSSEFSPFITNDGVTIARNVESDDPIIDSILEIAKESALKTNELVGDGTTTTLVLLEKMIEKGLEFVKNGYNAMTLKREMESGLEKILAKIEQQKESPTKENFLEVAKSSSNEEELGLIANEVFQKIGYKSGIRIQESTKEKTTYEFLKGYVLEANIDKTLFEIDFLKEVWVLLVDGEVESLEEISEILNEVLKEQRNLVLLANDYSEEVKNELISYSLDHKNKILACETPEYGIRKMEILKDMEVVTKGKIWHKNRSEFPSLGNLGYCKNLEIGSDMLLFSYEIDENLKKRKEIIQKQILECTKDYEKEFLEERLAKLNIGFAILWIGGVSKTSIREKKMRMEDAICALECTKKGVVPSSSFTLFTLKEQFTAKNKGEEIILEALDAPMYQILSNSGLDAEKILSKIRKENYQVLYNVKEEKFEKKRETTVKDPAIVVQTSLKNAVSISGMLLTTSHLVLHEAKESPNEL